MKFIHVYKTTAKEIQCNLGVTLTPTDAVSELLPEGKELNQDSRLKPGDLIIVTLPDGGKVVVEVTLNSFSTKLKEYQV